MIPKPAPDPLRALALLAAAAVCAALANGMARSDRKLAWSGWTPPPMARSAAPAGPVQPPASAPPAPATPARPAPPGPASVPPRPPGPPPGAPRGTASRPPAGAPPQAPPGPPPGAGATTLFAPAPDQAIRDLSGEEAWAAFQQKAPFLDARRTSDYLEGHVSGAWSVPIWEAEAGARITEFEARANPAPAAPIVIYCSGGDCHDSRILAQRLVQLGYRNLFIYRDGYPDWIQHGRPQARGARP